MSSYKSWLNEQKKKINKTFDTQKEQTEQEYGQAINQTSSAYESEYRQNEVDRIFNEKKIAEINANLGLTNSGLNRTQQTAVQLSHANRNYDISKSRQESIDDLTLQKAKAITDIENNRTTALDDAQSQYESLKSSSSSKDTSSGNTDDNYTYWSYDGIDEETGKYIFSDGDGNTKTLAAGINPYTGAKINANGFDLWNGYQPKGIAGHGGLTLEDENGPWNNGHQLRVWKTNDGKKWVWDDYLNGVGGYVEVEYVNGEWVKVL